MTRIPVFLLVQSIEEIPGSGDSWLDGVEREELSGLWNLKRRRDWQLGRWTAKRLLGEVLRVPASPGSLARIGVRRAPDGAPEALFDGRPLKWTLSISHSEGRGLAAVAEQPAALGCDLERVRLLRPATVDTFFTPEEQGLLDTVGEDQRPMFSTLVWSAKESALKALRQGLRLDTRTVSVSFVPRDDGGVWGPLAVRYTGRGRTLRGWWRSLDGWVVTVVAQPDPATPAFRAPS